MSALEQEVIEKFRLLDREAQQRVRVMIDRETMKELPADNASDFDYERWFQEVENFRQKIDLTQGGKFPSVDVIEMLREIRDGEDE